MAKAKYDAITLSQAFNAVLKIIDPDAGYNAGSGPPIPFPHTYDPCVESLEFSAMGGLVTFSVYSEGTLYDAQTADPGTPPPGQIWIGMYMVWRMVVTGPGASPVTTYFCTHLEDGYTTYPPGSYPLPGPLIAGDIEIACSVAVSNLFLKGGATDANPTSRGFLWFGDRSFAESWWVDEDSEVTITATVQGTDYSSSGSFAEAGNEFEFGSTYVNTCTINMDWFFEEDTVYARIDDWQFDDEPVDLDNLLLYDPGTDDYARYSDGWGRVRDGSDNAIVDHDANGITMEYNGASHETTSASWQGIVWAPFQVNFRPDDGKFARDVAYDITYIGPVIAWEQDYAGTWTAYYVTWNDTLEVVQQQKSWEYQHEWQTLATTTMYVNEYTPWRTAQDEDVGSSPNNDDIAVPLIVHPRDSTVLTGDPQTKWGNFITVVHEGEIPVCKPASVTRPANWTGGGGMTPLAASGTNNDTWIITAGSQAATATFVLPSRYWTRMNRLADHGADETYHLSFFPYLNRPNVDSTPADGYLDPPEQRIPEAEWHWRNYRTLELRFTTAPRNATITAVVTYSYPSYIYDPCYTNFDDRYGTNGVFEYSRSTATATFQFDVTAGSSTVSVVDLKIPLDGTICAEYHVVEKIVLTFDATPAGDDETWVLDDIYLSRDKVTDPDSHLQLRMYDPYDWEAGDPDNEADVERNLSADYTMFAGLFCGIPVFDIPYGYDDFERTERSLKGRQKRRHPPLSEATGILDYAKAIDVLRAEIDFQRGWDSTDTDAANAVVNKDGDDNKVVAQFRWFDLRECNEWAKMYNQTLELTGAPRVQTWKLAAGVEHDVYHVKFPQGRVHALAYEEDRSDAQRGASSFYLWQRLGSAAWTQLEGPISSDTFGRIRFSPQKEKDYDTGAYWTYGMSEAVDETPTVYHQLANRRYWWTYIPSPSSKGVCVIEQLPGFVYIPYTADGIKHVYNAPADNWFSTRSSQAHYGLPRTDTTEDDSCPSGYVAGDGVVRLFVLRSDDLYRLDSPNWGLSWEAAVATAITTADQAFAWASRDLVNQFCVWVSGGTLTFSASHDHFTTLDESAEIATGVDASQLSGYHGPDGVVYVYGFVDSTLTCWKSITRGRAWTEVGTV